MKGKMDLLSAASRRRKVDLEALDADRLELSNRILLGRSCVPPIARVLRGVVPVFIGQQRGAASNSIVAKNK